MTKLVAEIFLALPAPALLWGGWILFLAGAGVFASGMLAKKHNEGKFRVNLGLCAAAFGLAMLLMPSHPEIAVALLSLLVVIVLWAFGGFLFALIFS